MRTRTSGACNSPRACARARTSARTHPYARASTRCHGPFSSGTASSLSSVTNTGFVRLRRTGKATPPRSELAAGASEASVRSRQPTRRRSRWRADYHRRAAVRGCGRRVRRASVVLRDSARGVRGPCRRVLCSAFRARSAALAEIRRSAPFRAVTVPTLCSARLVSRARTAARCAADSQASPRSTPTPSTTSEASRAARCAAHRAASAPEPQVRRAWSARSGSRCPASRFAGLPALWGVGLTVWGCARSTGSSRGQRLYRRSLAQRDVRS
jgi:hypothetical protein